MAQKEKCDQLEAAKCRLTDKSRQRLAKAANEQR